MSLYIVLFFQILHEFQSIGSTSLRIFSIKFDPSKSFQIFFFFFFGKKELYFYDKFVGKIDTCQVSSVLINNGRKVFPINSMMEVK